jgi:hypothetical protein
VHWIGLDQDRDQWRALVNMVMNFLFCSFNIPSLSLSDFYVIKITLLYILLAYLRLIIYIHITCYVLKHVLHG